MSNGVVMGSDVSAKGGQVGTFDLSGMTLIPRPKPSDAIPITKQNVTISYTSGSFKQKAETGLVTYWDPMNLGAENGYETGGLYAYGEINSRTSFDINEHAHYGHNSTYFDVIGGAYFYIPLQTGTYFANLGYSSNGPGAEIFSAKTCLILRSLADFNFIFGQINIFDYIRG